MVGQVVANILERLVHGLCLVLADLLGGFIDEVCGNLRLAEAPMYQGRWAEGDIRTNHGLRIFGPRCP